MEEFSGVALSDESGGIFVNFNADPSNGLYESYNYESDSLNRLYVHVADHTSEDVYFGFNVRRLWFVSCGSGNVAGNYTATSGNVVYWRLRDPNGNAVDSGSIAAYNGGTAASTTTGYIGNYTQANNGPDGVDGVGTTGYTPETYNPTVNGDYYFEFNYGDQISPYDASACSRSTIDFQYFDITVVDGTSSIQGRVWSRQWSLVSVNRAPNQSIAANSSKIHVSSAGSPGSSIEDTDGDGIPDSQDLDSDNDGITDLAENPDGTGVDANNDGIVDGSVDADRDGIIESADTDDNTDGSPGSDPSDRDSDGIADAIDLDSDNDGITDLAENPDGSGIDSNNDGIVDGSSDSDGDGILNSADSDDSNAGSPNSEPTDTDGDGLADAIDIDSDNDGITDLRENIDGSGTDANNDGVVDGATDSDGDGILNSADSNDGAAGSPNSDPTDTDSDNLANPYDIDSDDDGIVDLIEAQLTGTGSPTIPGGTDTDGDGLDNNFESTGLVPIDTDGDTTPDYLDSDSDDDGEDDILEGWDTDGDGTADTSPANSDSDGDGLDDNFDDYDNSTPSETLNSTNNSQDALDFPNEDEGGDERDWREEPCAGGTLALSPVNTTTTASVSCRQGAWTYYYNPADSTELLFAIEHFPSGAGNNTNEFTATVSLTVSSDPDAESGVYSATDVGNEQATFVMGRYWNVSITSGSLNGNVNIRYYFDPNDSDTLQAVAERWNDANANSTSFVSGRRWFTMNSGTFDPGTGDLTAAGINASQELFPSSQSTEDGIDYVQFNGLSSLTGGGQAYTIGENSVILPVELLEYKAQLIEDEVLSSWITATEINSDYFEIERSIDKLNWDVVGTVGAAGNSNRELYYQHFDTKPLKGVSYYRLKSIDLNQSFEYSQVEVISIGLQSGLALVYPNPNMGTFNVSLTDPSTVSSIEIYSSTGQLVRRMSTNGKTEFTFSGMANGYYNLSIVGTNERFVTPIVVSK